MSGYVRNIEAEVMFCSRPVRLTLKPLTRGDMFALQGLLPDGRPDAKKSLEAFEFYADKLPGYITACSGVLDAAGEEVPVAEWVAGAYFIELVGAVMTAHMQRATPVNPS